MPAFARSFPVGPGKRAMVRKDEAEGEVARGGSGLQRVVKAKELDEAKPLVAGRQGGAIKAKATAARRLLEAGSSGKPQGAVGVAGN